MSDLPTAIRDVLVGFASTRPKNLFSHLALELEDSGIGHEMADVLAAVTAPDPNAPGRFQLSLALAKWDYAAANSAPWTRDTAPQSGSRREHVYSVLGFPQDAFATLTATFPIFGVIDTEIYGAKWDPWYTEERRSAHNFYWSAYSSVLRSKQWEPEAIASVDEMTNRIVGRLADPTASAPYQSKGLVAGYVQSGKTANFTGLVAKSVDVGYRLVIVLTGTIELLRTQTQRRLDMELVGEENILGGVDRDDSNLTKDIDYVGFGDADWIAGNFLRHGINISAQPGVPSIKRLTSFKSDFRRLKLGIDALDFRRTGELKNPAKPVHDPANIYDVDARLAVVKKNKTALTSLISDLKSIRADAREIPVLIIDDEADQASINTKKPTPSQAAEQRERTQINKLISELLTLLPRSQYVAYTATPYANVFVAPEDSADIYPKDFIISLEPPPTYMGAKDFHDLIELAPGVTRTPANRNELAFVRDLRAANDEEFVAELQAAIDAFVLSGAIKLWRSTQVKALKYRHHTMLVHSSHRQADHLHLYHQIKAVWATSQYAMPSGLARLRAHYEADFVNITAARAWGPTAILPESFDDLRDDIGKAVSKIMAASDPAVIVNGSKESDYDAADFTKGPYWRILVGGTSLSRGFTVEGLTVSYFARRTQTQASLMQMGRWFGYRPGYMDLVRLYMAREVPGPGRAPKVYDLYDDFTSIVQDEEDFREQLRVYSELTEDGKPVMTPLALPPMVFQRRPWLRPTAANQMYNVAIVQAGIGGKVSIHGFPFDHTGTGPAKHAANFAAVKSWLGGEVRKLPTDSNGEFAAQVRIVPAEEVWEALSKVQMQQDLRPTLGFMRSAIDEGNLQDFAVVSPDMGRHVELDGRLVPTISRRRRTPNRDDFPPPGLSQRRVIEDLVADVSTADTRPRLKHPGVTGVGYAGSLWDPMGKRGALLMHFIQEETAGGARPVRAPSDLILTFAVGMPFRAAPRGRLAYQAIDNGQPNAIVISALAAPTA